MPLLTAFVLLLIGVRTFGWIPAWGSCVRKAILAIGLLSLTFGAGSARAGEPDPMVRRDPWKVDWANPAAALDRGPAIWQIEWQASTPPLRTAAIWPQGMSFAQSAPAQDAQASRPKAVEYSERYYTRRKIHFIASFATLPLFATQVVLGQKLYDGSTGGVRTAHVAVATSIAALFAVNSVTGVWNLWEARKDPMHRAKRLTHGLMMLGADAGFVATGMLAPDEGEVGDRAAHRAVALTSMGVATAAYLLMLLTR
jgi:hypothetical protein